MREREHRIATVQAAASKEAHAERRRGSCALIVKGEKRIMALQPLLILFSERCGQPGTMEDLAYFLQKPGLLRRVPYLCLVARRPVESPSELAPEDLLGSLLLLEYRVLKLGTRSFATNDRSARGSLLALPQDRLRVASMACEVLLARGANVAMLSFLGGNTRDEAQHEPKFRRLSQLRSGMMWAMRERNCPAYLQMCPTLDQTLATLGQKTRSNMRYYRRRAEKELSAMFVPHAEVTAHDLVQFNSECMYPVSKPVVRWRLRVQTALHDPFLMGLKDADGRWLSILAGRRFGETSEILWQMNRDGYPMHSLGTAMRSFCMEHELLRGAKRLQVEGGTFHSMHHSFVQEEIIDLVVVRARSQRVIRKLVTRFIPPDNSLAEMMKNDGLEWHAA